MKKKKKISDIKDEFDISNDLINQDIDPDNIDILDIDDDINIDQIDEDILSGDIIEEIEDEDDESNTDVVNDINVVKCPNCKEDVLESEFCPICGKPLKSRTISKQDEYTENEEINNNDFFDMEDNYIPEDIEKKIDEEYYD